MAVPPCLATFGLRRKAGTTTPVARALREVRQARHAVPLGGARRDGRQAPHQVPVGEALHEDRRVPHKRRRFYHRASLVTFKRFEGDTVWCPIETTTYDLE